MKKNIIATATLLMLAGAYCANACTNLLVTKGATVDNSTMITYTADSHTLYGELYFKPAKDYPAGTMVDVYEWDTGRLLGKIKQVAHTYSVVGNMNEYQVSIGETTFTGLKKLQDTTAVVDYGSLIYTALQRAKTAREAVKIMADLVNEYGYYSTGESFSISDPDEVWIMEMIGKGSSYTDVETGQKSYSKGAVWVAIRIPDGCISGHANHARITKFPLENGKTSISYKNINKIFNPLVEVVYASDVISYAKASGLYDKTKADSLFSFTDIYCPADYGAVRFCESRVWSAFRKVNSDMDKYFAYVNGDSNEKMPLYIKPDKKLSAHDLMELMRDHFEGTPYDMTKDVGAGPFACPYRWRPMEWKLDSVTYVHERAISTQQTGFSFVAQSRSWMPSPIGGILWFGVDDSYSTVYVPMYCGITKVPESYAEGNGNMMEFTWKSAFWVFNWVANYSYSRYSDMIKDVQIVQKELEGKYLADTDSIDAKALELYKASPVKALEFVTDYSCTQGDYTVDRWRKLGEYLLVKYMDGNVKKEKNGRFQDNGFDKTMIVHPSHPRYSDDWYRKIVEEKGDSIKEKKLP
jgi:dipeptidase